MIQRAFSTITLWAILAVLLSVAGTEASVWLLVLLGVLAQHELYRILERLGQQPFRKLGIALGAALIAAPHYARRFGDAEISQGLDASIVALVLVICCCRVLAERDAPHRFVALSSTLFGLIYVPFMFQFLVRTLWLYGGPDVDPARGLLSAVYILAVAKFCDVGAYVTGTLAGKHRMAPNISPKKTWEGAVGGVVVAAFVGAGFAWAWQRWAGPGLDPLAAALIAIPIAVSAIVSDLVESVLKRAAEMKDSGRSIPGIGGAFDLTDSLVLAAPVGYVLLLVFAR